MILPYTISALILYAKSPEKGHYLIGAHPKVRAACGSLRLFARLPSLECQTCT
jgi:hypothetical protein